MRRVACLLPLLLLCLSLRAEDAKTKPLEWLKLHLDEVSLDAPFVFQPKRDSRSSLPPEMAEQFVSFDIHESETTGAFPMHVNVVRIRYRDAEKVNIDATVRSSFLAVAEQQDDKDALYDQNTVLLDGLDARRIHYNGLGKGKPVSVESVAARQGPILWTVMVTYNKNVPRDAVLRLLDSVHINPPQPVAPTAAPAVPKKDQGWLISSLDEVTLEAPFVFSAKRDTRDQLPEAALKQFDAHDTWTGTGQPALPLEVTLTRLQHKEGVDISLESLASNHIRALAKMAGEDPSLVSSTPSTRDGIPALETVYDGLARGRKSSTHLLLARSGLRVWILQAVWNGDVPPETPARLMASVHFTTPAPNLASLEMEKPDNRTLEADLASTFIWCSAMKATLQDVVQSVPELADDATRAGLEWDSVFKPSYEAIIRRIKDESGKEWEHIQQQLKDTLGPARVAAFTIPQGTEIVANVRKHARGIMPPVVLRTLLASNPAYKLHPAREISDGFTALYSFSASPKGQGLKLNLRRPLSWGTTSLDVPEVLAQWASDGGHGGDFIRLSVTHLPATATPETSEALFSAEGSRALLPEGGKFLSWHEGRLNEQALGILHFNFSPPSGISGSTLRCVMYYFLSGYNLVSVQCMTTPAADNDAAREDRHKHMEPLFQAVLGSFRKE